MRQFSFPPVKLTFPAHFRFVNLTLIPLLLLSLPSYPSSWGGTGRNGKVSFTSAGLWCPCCLGEVHAPSSLITLSWTMFVLCQRQALQWGIPPRHLCEFSAQGDERAWAGMVISKAWRRRRHLPSEQGHCRQRGSMGKVKPPGTDLQCTKGLGLLLRDAVQLLWLCWQPRTQGHLLIYLIIGKHSGVCSAQGLGTNGPN